MTLTTLPAFGVYAATAIGLGVLMVLVDTYAGVVRARSKTTLNPEDARTVVTGAKVVDEDPPGVARVMRAHRNLVANAVPFLLLGLVWVASGATRSWAFGVFGVFVAARVAHALAYIAEKQPLRTVAFAVGQGALVVLVVQLARAILTG